MGIGQPAQFGIEQGEKLVGVHSKNMAVRR
jgi:hypothetical protein